FDQLGDQIDRLGQSDEAHRWRCHDFAIGLLTDERKSHRTSSPPVVVLVLAATNNMSHAYADSRPACAASRLNTTDCWPRSANDISTRTVRIALSCTPRPSAGKHVASVDRPPGAPPAPTVRA